MDKKVFNNIVKNFLLNKSFKYNSKKRRYIKEFNDSYMKIQIQKSNSTFENSTSAESRQFNIQHSTFNIQK